LPFLAAFRGAFTVASAVGVRLRDGVLAIPLKRAYAARGAAFGSGSVSWKDRPDAFEMGAAGVFPVGCRYHMRVSCAWRDEAL
jgi:hypothetical protein